VGVTVGVSVGGTGVGVVVGAGVAVGTGVAVGGKGVRVGTVDVGMGLELHATSNAANTMSITGTGLITNSSGTLK
jgi:hypothetical protein